MFLHPPKHLIAVVDLPDSDLLLRGVIFRTVWNDDVAIASCLHCSLDPSLRPSLDPKIQHGAGRTAITFLFSKDRGGLWGAIPRVSSRDLSSRNIICLKRIVFCRWTFPRLSLLLLQYCSSLQYYLNLCRGGPNRSAGCSCLYRCVGKSRVDCLFSGALVHKTCS